MLKVNQMQDYSYDEAHCGYGDTGEMKNNLVLNGYDIAMAELLQTRQDQMLRNAGIGARGFSWADDFSNVHSTNFAGMNTSGVISTGSWGSPRENFTTIVGNDGHAVSGFDFIDVSPADRIFLDGVRNGYSLIEQSDLGSVDNKVDNAAEEGRPHEGRNVACETPTEPILNIQSGYQGQNNSSANAAGFSAEDFGIVHTAILSHDGQLGEKNV